MAQFDELPVFKATYDLLLEMLRFNYWFRFKKLDIRINLFIQRNANTVSWGNLLVTVFAAPYLLSNFFFHAASN
jgi:hypothetical protein